MTISTLPILTSNDYSLLLAQMTEKQKGSLVYTVVVCLGIIIVTLIGYILIKKFTRTEDDSIGNDLTGVFDLDELRRLRDSGEITLTQYTRLRQITIQAMGGTIKTDNQGNESEILESTDEKKTESENPNKG